MNASNSIMNAPEDKKKISLFAVYFGIISMMFMSSINSTLLPVAAMEIGGTDIYSMVNTVSGVIGICFMPLFGSLCQKRPSLKITLFSMSFLLAAVCRILCAFAPNIFYLIVVTILQAPLSAGVFVCGYGLISSMFDRQKTGTCLGLCGTFMAFGMVLAPVIGGLVIQYTSWRAMYAICGAMFAVTFIMSLFGIKLTKEEADSMAQQGGTLDYVGMIGTMLFLAGIILVLSLCNSFMPFGSLPNTLCLIVSAIGLVLVVISVKKKGNAAFIPALALKDRNVLLFTVANLTQNLAAMAVFFFIPTYILYVLNGTPTQASIPTTLFGVIGIFAGRFFGQMIGKSGTAKGTGIITGVSRLAVLLILAAFLKPSSSVWFIYVMMFIGGIFNSAGSVSFSAGPQVQLRPEVRMTGNSIIQMGQNFGSSIGTALFTMILGMKGVAGGMTTALYIAAAIGVVSTLCMLGLQTIEQQSVSQ